MPPKKTQEIFDHLKRAAREMRTVTYGELAKSAGLANQGVAKPLGYIRDEVCRARGLPWLTAIAVAKDTRQPNDGFSPDDDSVRLNWTKPDFRVWWRSMVLLVFATDWSEIELRRPST